MSNEPLSSFLSEKSIYLHKEYLKTERARYSILEKSFSCISGKSFSEIYAMRRIDRDDRAKILARLASVTMHDIYFYSFTLTPAPCEAVREYYSSESAFLYEAWLLGREKRCGFLYFYLDRRGKPCFDFTDTGLSALMRVEPRLAVDLCEHAYFLDYGFDSGEYLRRALGYLDISRLVDKS